MCRVSVCVCGGGGGGGGGDRRWNRVSPTRTTPLIYPFPTFQLISNVIYIVKVQSDNSLLAIPSN